VLDFLFSPKGGLLRQQLVDALVDRVDAISWRAFRRLGSRLPSRLQPPGLRSPRLESSENALLSLEPVQQLLMILRQLPGFEPQLLLRRLPRLLGEPDLRRMGVQLAQGLAERSVVRLLRDVLVAPELRQSAVLSATGSS
jgi:hypothetical protein